MTRVPFAIASGGGYFLTAAGPARMVDELLDNMARMEGSRVYDTVAHTRNLKTLYKVLKQSKGVAA
jgi:hypothetical protein